MKVYSIYHYISKLFNLPIFCNNLEELKYKLCLSINGFTDEEKQRLSEFRVDYVGDWDSKTGKIIGKKHPETVITDVSVLMPKRKETKTDEVSQSV